MFHALANTVQVLLKGRHLDSDIMNTYYFKYQAGLVPNEAELRQLLDDFIFQIAAPLTEMLTNVTQFDEAIARDMSAESGVMVSRFINPPIQGGVNLDPVPANSSLGVRRKSALAGRTNRGRVSLPPFPEDRTRGDTIVPLQASLVSAFGAALMTALPRSGGGVFRPSTPNWRDGFSNAIASVVFDVILDSMKTRLTGHGS